MQSQMRAELSIEPDRRVRRWLKRGALGVVALLVVAVAAALVAMHTSWGREMIRAQVEHQLETMFTGGATLGRVEGSPLGTLTLHDLVINGPDRRPAISVKTLTVELGILPLLSHQARVGRVVADDVDVDLRRDPDGALQIARLMVPGPKSAWSVDLPSIQLRRAHVRFDGGPDLGALNFDAVALEARAKLPHDGPIDASLELRGTWRERQAAALNLRTVVHSDPRGLAVPYLALRAGDISVIGNHVTVAPGDGHVPAIGGSLIITASAAAVARLAPDVRLPADLAVMLIATPLPGQRWTQLSVAGNVDHTPVWFQGAVDLDARHARGELSTGTLDLAKLSSGRLAGSGAARAVFDVRPGGPQALPIATATIRGWGAVAGVPTTAFDIALSSAGERMRAAIDATGEGIRVKLTGTLHVVGDLLAIEDATLHASSTDPARASGGRAPVHGALRADLVASGTLRPAPNLAVAGTIDGRQLRVQDLSVASLHLSIDARRLPDRPLGKAHVELVDLVRGDMQLGALTVDAVDRVDGKIAVSVRSRPKQNPWLLDADAIVTPPGAAGTGTVAGTVGGTVAGTVTIDVLRHRVRAGNGSDWTGTTGHVEIGPERISVRDFTSASSLGHLAIAGSYERAGRRRGDLAANIDATGLALATLSSAYHGRLDAHVVVARRGVAWDGDVRLDGTNLSIDPSAATLETHARATLHGTKLAVTATADSVGLGSAKLALELEVPAAVTDPRAWQRLGKDALRSGELAIHGVEVPRAMELAGLAGGYTGRIDGDFRMSPGQLGGRLEAHHIVAPELRGLGGPGGVDVVLDVSQPSPTELAAALTANVEGVGGLSAQAQLAVPERLFDLAAWSALGRGALRSATVRAENITVDPAMLDRFGIASELRGQVSVAVDVGEAGRTVQAALDVSALRGDPFVEPIDVHLTAVVDDRSTSSTLTVRTAGKTPGKTGDKTPGKTGDKTGDKASGTPADQTAGVTLLEAQGRIPGSILQLIDRLRSDPEAANATPLSASVTLGSVDAPRVLAVFGRTEVIAGGLDGTVELGGTLGRPTVKANLAATGLKVPPGPGGKPIRTVEKLTLSGSWDGDTAKLDLDGVESEGGALRVSLSGRLRALRDGTLTVKATKFDLVPILAFAPGPAGGASGQLDADLRFTGLDLRTTQVAGELHLLDARVPIAPAVGTLRKAKIDAVIADHEIKLIVDGKLGAGTIAVTGTVALDGAAPNAGKAKITLRKVSPIGVVEPQLSADIAATLSHDHEQWHADLVVDHANVVVPNDRGEKLKPAGPPSDMTFANGDRLTRRPMKHEQPAQPIFVVDVHLQSTRVQSEEFRGLIKGELKIRADGDSIGLVGGIEAESGDLDLFARRYYIERAGVHFDGSLDPLLDVRITHEFSDVTTVTEVRGRLSKPELTMSSDPGTYSQGQLLGFLLGGDPGGDPQSGSMSNTVTDAGTSFVANKIGGYVRDALPIDIDVLRYEAATASSGPAVVVGTWLTHALFLAYRQHLEASQQANTGEGEVEYWLSRQVVIEATAGDRGYNGLDLLWRLRY